jgi:chaperonin GroES
MAASSLPKLSVTIEPLGDHVLVMPIEAEQITSFGIVIPDTAKGEKPQQGIILALGKGGIPDNNGKVVNPHDFLKVGDRVLFGKYAGDEVKLKDKDNKNVEVKVLNLNSILGLVK